MDCESHIHFRIAHNVHSWSNLANTKLKPILLKSIGGPASGLLHKHWLLNQHSVCAISQQQGLYFAELSSKSTWLLGRESVVSHTTPSMLSKFWVHARRQCRVSINNILYHFIEGQTHHFGIPRGVKIVYSSQWTEMGCSAFKFKHNYLQACIITSRKKEIVYIVHQTTTGES